MLPGGSLDDGEDPDTLRECVPNEADVREVVFKHMHGGMDGSGRGGHATEYPPPPGYESAFAA